MKLLKNVALGFLLLIVGLLLIAFLLPATTHVERRTVIHAPAGKIFSVIRDFNHFDKWSPWADIDPNVQVTLTGIVGEVGSQYSWRGNDSVGAGSQVITELVADQRVAMHLIFEGQGEAQVTLQLNVVASGTDVVWSFDSEHGMNPLNRWFGLMFDSMIGADYEKGLDRLKRYVETLPDAAPVNEPATQSPQTDVLSDAADQEPPVDTEDSEPAGPLDPDADPET